MTIDQLKTYISEEKPLKELLPYIYMTIYSSNIHAYNNSRQKEVSNIFYQLKQINVNTKIKHTLKFIDQEILKHIKPEWFDIKINKNLTLNQLFDNLNSIDWSYATEEWIHIQDQCNQPLYVHAILQNKVEQLPKNFKNEVIKLIKSKKHPNYINIEQFTELQPWNGINNNI